MIFFYQKSISWYLSCRNLSVTSCPLQTDSSGSSPVSSRHFVSNPHMNEILKIKLKYGKSYFILASKTQGKLWRGTIPVRRTVSDFNEYDQNYQEHFKNNKFSYILHSPLTPSLAVSNQVQL